MLSQSLSCSALRILLVTCLLAIVGVRGSFAQLDVSAVVTKCNPAVVLVRVLNNQESLIGTGSGFVVAPGLIATCYHVVAGGATVRVKTNDRIEYPVADVVASNRALDIAILKVDKIDQITPLKLRQISDVKAGEAAIAMGSPLGLEGCVTTGVVSAVREMGDWGTVIQTSAPISSGNSGGPLLDAEGQVMGMVQFTLVKGQNVNFAIPATTIAELIEKAKSSANSNDVGATKAGSTIELLQPKGMLPLQSAYMKLKVPKNEPYSVALPGRIRYKVSSIKVSAGDKPLYQVDKRENITPATYWVSDMGSVWVDKSFVKKEIKVSYEYTPCKVAAYVAQDVSDGDLRDVLITEIKRFGDEPVAGADASAAVAQFGKSEDALLKMGKTMDCAYLIGASLNSNRTSFGNSSHVVV